MDLVTLNADVMSDNELIAEFMGSKPYEDSRYGTLWPDPTDGNNVGFGLKYDSSWDWLMPVVQRIYKLYDESNITSFAQENMFLHVLHNPIKYPLHIIYKDVVEFIKWHNRQKL